MSDDRWDRLKWEWVSEKELKRLEAKALNRYTRTREKNHASSDTFTTNSCDQKTETNKNKDLAQQQCQKK